MCSKFPFGPQLSSGRHDVTVSVPSTDGGSPLPKSIAVLALVAFAVTASSSKADTTFTVNGTFANANPYGGTDSLTGTVTIDTTGGTATAWDVNLGLSSGLASFFGTSTLTFDAAPATTILFAGDVELSGLAAGGLDAQLNLFLPVSTLVGYSGGSLLDSSSGPPTSQLVPPGGEGSYASLEAGTLTPPLSTPEPATFTLLATGFLAFGGYGLFRRRRGTTETTPA
jgi:hypothetical protein